MINQTRNLLAQLRRDERGLTAVEYAVLGAIVVGAIVAIGGDFKTGLDGAFDYLLTSIPTAG